MTQTSAVAPQRPITITDVRIWNGVTDSYLENADAVRIENGRISAIGSTRELSDGAQLHAGGGKTVLPGLIDAHVHLCLNPGIREALAQGQESQAELQRLIADRCLEMVRAGITSARDLGGGTWDELAIRDRILAGELVGPRLVCSGQPITSVHGHCHFWGGEAADVHAALDVLERQIAKGVDLIKVMATGGSLTPGSTPSMSQFDAATLTSIVERATQHGRHVAAHCHGTQGIGYAAQAGVTTIEHCSWVGPAGWGMDYDEQVAAAIAARGVWISPTINAGWKRNIGRTDFEARVRDNYRRMREAGIKLIASTDAGIPNVLHHHLPLALPVFAHFANLTPAEALRSATSDCATAIGIGQQTGRIDVGMSADLLLVDGDVLADLGVLENPVQVWARGVAVL